MHVRLTDIFLVPHDGRYILHAPLHGVTALLNADAATSLRDALCSGMDGDLPRELLPVLEKLRWSPRPPEPPQGPFAPRVLGLLPTNDCNMRCLYCAVGAGDGDRSTMPVEICESALLHHAGIVGREGFDAFDVNYFGGEPFVAWEVVRHCDAFGRGLAEGLGVPFRAVCDTNGYMSEERARWVARHLFHAVVSVDGPAELHDRMRPAGGGAGTHEIVARTLRIFLEEGFKFTVRCNVSVEATPRLPEIADYLCRTFRPQSLNVEPILEDGRCLQTGLKTPEPVAYVRGVVAAGRIARSYGVELKLSAVRTDRVAPCGCGVSQDLYVVTPDGLVTSCYGANHRGSPHAARFTLGYVDAGERKLHIDPERLARARSRGVQGIGQCADCFCKWHCAGGCRLYVSGQGLCGGKGPGCWVTQQLTRRRLLEDMQLFDEADRVGAETGEPAYA